jgi:hypothetical protein
MSMLSFTTNLAYFHADMCAGSTGAILQDFHVRTSKEEAIAMLEGLTLSIRIGCNWIQDESDSFETIEVCKGGDR